MCGQLQGQAEGRQDSTGQRGRRLLGDHVVVAPGMSPVSHRPPLSAREPSPGPSALLLGTRHSLRRWSALGRRSGPIRSVSWNPSLPAGGDPTMRPNTASGGLVSQPILSFCASGVGYAAICNGPRHAGLARSLLTRPRGNRANTQGLSQTRSRWNWASGSTQSFGTREPYPAPGAEGHAALLSALPCLCFVLFCFFKWAWATTSAALSQGATHPVRTELMTRVGAAALRTVRASGFIRGRCSPMRQKQAGRSPEGKQHTGRKMCSVS